MPLRARKRLFYSIGITAIASELVWMECLLLIWTLFIGMFLLRKIKVLIVEPYVTLGALMGAAAGYLLIGYPGAYLLHTLLLWHPASFDQALLPVVGDPLQQPMRTFPAMVLAPFGSLTTVGHALVHPRHLLGLTGSLLITLMGQRYMAVLIALILGRFHRRKAF